VNGLDKLWALIAHTKTRKRFQADMCQKTFKLSVVAEIILYVLNGAAAHICRAMQHVLSNIYHDYWPYRRSPTVCPSRLSDLNLCNFTYGDA
jgi:hypothetical protein